MLRSLVETAVLITPLGLLGIVMGDPYLLSTGNYRLITLLWVSHLIFWLAYLAVLAPLFLAACRGGRRLPGDEVLGFLLVGLAGLGFAFGACAYYLHQDLGFFSPRRLPVNGAVFALALAACGIAFRALRPRAESLARRRWALPVAGLAMAAGIWGTMYVKSLPSDVQLGIEALAPAASEGSASPAGVMGTPNSGRVGRRVILLGLDGADWRVIDPMAAAGALPNFARLKAEGVTAPMHTISPFSPVVWTSIATGMDPGRHSVQYFSEMYSPHLDVTVQRLNFNFLEPLMSRVLEKIPVSSTTRTAKAIWEILDIFGRRSLVINWWASFPTEPCKGILISNYAMPWDELSPERIARLGGAGQRVYPEEVWPEVVSVMQEAVRDRASASSGEGTDLEKKITNTDFWDLRDRIVEDLFLRFDRPDYSLSALYLQGIDTTSHHMSESVFGANKDLPRDPKVGPGVIAQKQAMLEAVYARMDTLLGTLMGKLADGDLMVVVSDHGWRYDGTSHWRMPDAIFALFGSAVRRGFSPGPVQVYDVAPTLLHYFGLPVSREMPGRILDAVFTAEANELLPRVTVPSYGPRVRRVRLMDAAMDAEYRAKLKSLGYVQ